MSRKSQHVLARLAGVVLTVELISGNLAWADSCAPGSECVPVSATGAPAQFIAQCTGRFPDFVVPSSMMPPDGPSFKLSQN
jgi:hypothetical protein